MEKVIRLLPYAEADGATNMAADEVLLQSAAAEGTAALRFYGWSTPTVSLGYFQPAAARDNEPLLAQLLFVRRATGGATLVHHHEVTYALALPPTHIGKESWLLRMHRIITNALAALGVPCTLVRCDEEPPAAHVLCFQQFTPGDVLCQRGSIRAKVVGSAQRKAQQCLLQHGAILLKQSPFAPVLPGIAELTGVTAAKDSLLPYILDHFTAETRWRLVEGDWTDEEKRGTELLRATKYEKTKWNRKR